MTMFISTEIYNGMSFIGRVVERDRGRRCEAFTAAGAPIGVFTSRAKAASAVYQAARDQQHGVAA